MASIQKFLCFLWWLFNPETLLYSFRKLDSLRYFLVLNLLRFILWSFSWERCHMHVKRVCILLLLVESSLKGSRWLVVMFMSSCLQVLVTLQNRELGYTTGPTPFCSFFSSNSYCSVSGMLKLCYQTFEQEGFLYHLDKYLSLLWNLSLCVPNNPFLKSTLLDIGIDRLDAFSVLLFTNYLSLHWRRSKIHIRKLSCFYIWQSDKHMVLTGSLLC